MKNSRDTPRMLLKFAIDLFWEFGERYLLVFMITLKIMEAAVNG